MDRVLFLWLTALVSPFVISFYFLTRKRGNKNILKQKLPPEAGGGRPFIGHLRLLSRPDLPHITLSQMADKYGPIFTVRLGTHRALIVSSWEAAKECFTTNDIIFSNRSKTAAIQHMSYNFAMFGFSAYGYYWRELRKISVQNMLSTNRLAMLGDSFEIEIRRVMRKLYYDDDHEKVPLEMKKIFGDLAFNLMVRIIGGGNINSENKKIYTTDHVGGSDHEKLREAIRGFFRSMGMSTITDVLPFLKWLDYFGGINNAFKKTGKQLDGVLQAWLDHTKKHMIIMNKKTTANLAQDSDEIRDEGFMARMVVATAKLAQDFPQYGADTIVKATCQTMMLGGTDSITATLTWAMCLLLNNPSTIKRAQNELDLHVGRERQVKVSDIEKLVYTQSIIKETLRLYAPPLVLARESAEDCTVAGYHVPAGTRLIVNLWKLHRDPRVWDDPQEFQPDRFLRSHYKEFDVRGLHFELLPFGSGRRVCPGVSFALQFMELALATLLHGFHIETVSDEPVDMTGSLGSTNMKATPLLLRLTPRLSPTIYA